MREEQAAVPAERSCPMSRSGSFSRVLITSGILIAATGLVTQITQAAPPALAQQAAADRNQGTASFESYTVSDIHRLREHIEEAAFRAWQRRFERRERIHARRERRRKEARLLAAAQQASSLTSPALSHSPAPAGGGYGKPSAAFTACVIRAESDGDPTAYNPSTASGLFGFLLSTWDALGIGYPGGAYTAPVSVQYEGFYKEYAERGTAPWAPYDGC
jgi:predicted secreted protein